MSGVANRELSAALQNDVQEHEPQLSASDQQASSHDKLPDVSIVNTA